MTRPLRILLAAARILLAAACILLAAACIIASAAALIDLARDQYVRDGMARPMPRYTVCPDGVTDAGPDTICLDGG